jgi:hypothetical protein
MAALRYLLARMRALLRSSDLDGDLAKELEARVNAMPGIEASAVTTGVPPLDGGERLLEVEGARPGADASPVFVGTATVGPRFFHVAGAPVIRGRNFDERDGAPGSETVLVNQHLAARGARPSASWQRSRSCCPLSVCIR